MAEQSFSARLRSETEAWIAEGIVTAEQAAAIRARYGDPAEERRGSATTALAVIGGLTLGVGVIGFVAANWDGMSHGARLALLTLAVGGSYAAGFHFRDRTRSRPRLGEALYLLGVLLFGASLFLVGQMYNVEAHDPLALLIWAVAAFAVAFTVRSRAVAVTALLIFTGWLGFEVGTALEDSGDDAAGLAVVALERFRAAWLDETRLASAARGLGLVLGSAGVFVFTFAEAADELDGAAGE